MRIIGSRFAFIMLIKVITVQSECDTYVGCLRSFFNGFFGNHKYLKAETHFGNITIPGFESVELESEKLNNLLTGVSGFIEEELHGNIILRPQLNIYHNVGNNTAIYVKSLTINNHFGDIHDENISRDFDPKNNINQIVSDSEILTTTSKTTELTKVLNTTKVNSTTSNFNTSKDISISDFTKNLQQNEISGDIDPLDLYSDTDEEDNSTDYLKIDYLEMYKDTTNDYTDFKTTEIPRDVNQINQNDKEIKNMRADVNMFGKIKHNSSVYVDDKCGNSSDDVTKTIFPWIAAIFIKNNTSNQFDYYCDGALLSETIVITAARCMEYYGSKVDASNLLVLLGKSSLQTMSGTERAVKVKSVIIHENFTTEATAENDIAILLMEAVTLNGDIKTACLGGEKKLQAVTTGWAISGELTVIPFDKDNSGNCKDSQEGDNDKLCARYGNDVTVCPSYGGIYAVKNKNVWYLNGIRSGDPSDRGLCFNRNVYFTDLHNYADWIAKYLQ